MAINLLNTVPRHERRLRLLFDNTPAAGAFTSTAWYTVTSQDNLGTSPPVNGAIAIIGSPNAVDLALGADLVGGGLYLVAVAGMPCIDSTTCTGSMLFRFGHDLRKQNQEVPSDDYASLLYGVDLVWSQVDFVETTDGDLAVISGLANAQQAIRNRAFGAGLLWDRTWGAYARQYVDGTPGSMPNLKGDLVGQALADDRVKQADAQLSFDPNNPYAYFDLNATLIGGETIAPISIQVLG
jgi:hypothetical protein